MQLLSSITKRYSVKNLLRSIPLALHSVQMVDTLTAAQEGSTKQDGRLVRTTIRLPLQLHRAAKIAAAATMTSFQTLITEAVEAHLSRKK